MEKPCDIYRHFRLVKTDPPPVLPPDLDISLRPATVIVDPTDELYDVGNQLQRTVNFGVCRTPGGRIFVSYFSAKNHADETTGNWIMIMGSDDNGKTFRNRVAVNPPDFDKTRVFEGVFWLDPLNRLWYFYVQTYKRFDGREGVWFIRCDAPDADRLVFTPPRRICDGIISAPPIVLGDGRWLFTSYIHHPFAFHGGSYPDFDLAHTFWQPEKIGVSVHASCDRGETFETISSGLQFPYATFYENAVVEKLDGSLWMLIRGMNCTGESFSHDGGRTWTPAVPFGALPLPNTHFAFGRLKSGNLLLVANYKADMFSYFVGRNHLTALISTDDGKSWGDHVLLLDEREGTEQPAFHEADDGFIRISYGRAPQLVGESLLAIVTEEDILAGRLVNPKSRLRISCGRATGMKKLDSYPELVRIAEKYGIEL